MMDDFNYREEVFADGSKAFIKDLPNQTIEVFQYDNEIVETRILDPKADAKKIEELNANSMKNQNVETLEGSPTNAS